MSKKLLQIEKDQEAEFIANTWHTYNSQRREKIDDWMELRNYIFATDTRSTSNSKLPWKNSTTLPKLCQIRDNLHSNYVSALFPNDDWLRWEAYSKNDATKSKVEAIESYMGNKTRESHFRSTSSQLLYDYIDYGNVFATADFTKSYKVSENGDRTVDYVGPVARRISPLDIVFNPLAASFKDSFKIIRSIKSVGELIQMAEDEPDNAYLKKALANRSKIIQHANAYGLEDFDKAEGIQIDGFGNYFDYLNSGHVELLEFWGDLHIKGSDKIERNIVCTILDRQWIIRKETIPSWLGHAPIYHVGWRSRPDNLWAMGPLDNLVGMQYRIDHLENLKADAMDLAVLPPLKIIGEVEEFTYGPGQEIHIDEGGDVVELAKNSQWVIQSDNEIAILEQRMEMYAGAPREAMGIRTQGEKTAFEVQQLQNAAGRIFQEKINTFEMEVLEPLLNSMLELSCRNMDEEDVVRVMDDDLGVELFRTITKEGITASGKLRPVGARHFAAQSQLMQNLTGIMNSPIAGMLAPHTSSKQLAKVVEDVMGLGRYQLFKPNIAIFEQQETQRLMNQAQEDLQVEQSVLPDGSFSQQ